MRHNGNLKYMVNTIQINNKAKMCS